jgi:hypothetical protein
MTSAISPAPALMERVESESWADYQPADGALLGTTLLRIGGGVALAAPDDLSGASNRVMGIGFDEPVTAELLERIIAFYREQGKVIAMLMIAPQALPADWPAMCKALNICAGRSAIVKLSGEAHAVAMATKQNAAASPLDPGLRVAPVPAAQVREWATTMQQGFGRDDPRVIQMSAGLAEAPCWQLFGVFEGDAVVATGSLRVAGEVGHLFGGSTLSGSRGRGAQSALIATRAAAAQEAGCEWLIGEAGAEHPGQHNSSLHNQLRAGLTERYRRQTWVWREQA